MDVRALLLSVIGPTRFLVTLAKNIKQRCDTIDGEHGAANSLLKIYERMASQLSNLESVDSAKLNGLATHDCSQVRTDLEWLRSFAEGSEQKLRAKYDALGQSWRAATHPMRNALNFPDLERDADRAQQCVGRINEVVALADRVNHGAAASSSSRVADGFRARNTAPRNSGRIFIDFESKDGAGRPATFEGKLKAALLQGGTASSFGAIAHGMGGVGKTCTLRALAADREVKRRFPGGVYFMTLGADATKNKVIQELAGSVKASGGKSAAARVQKAVSLKEAIQEAQDWFAERCCLFIFDDLWQSRDIPGDILSQLSVLVSDCGEESGSRLLYSTRDKELSLQGETVPFREREPHGKGALAILLGTAGADSGEAEDEVCKGAIWEILERCAGLPLALNMCGTSVKLMRETWPGDARRLWDEYWRNFNAKSLMTDSTAQYGCLEAALLVSLEFLDNRLGVEYGLFGRLSYKQMHRALCVVEKQDWVPLPFLEKLWDMLDLQSTEGAVMDMARFGVVYAERRELDDGRIVLGLRLHDLVHDFAQHETKKQGEESKWAAAVLDSYRLALGDTEPDPMWVVSWDTDLDGGYITRNVCRLLILASRMNEVERLLRSARWSVKMLKMSEISLLERDVELYLLVRPKKYGAKRRKTGTEARSVVVEQGNEESRWQRALCKIVRLSLVHCAGNSHGAWFQLYARVMATAGKPEWMEDMMAEALVHAPRPWFKAVTPCLKGALDALVDTYYVPYSRIWAVQFVNGEVLSMGYDEDRHETDVFVGKHESSVALKIFQLKTDSSQPDTASGGHEIISEGSPRPHDDCVRSVAAFNNGSRVATGWGSGAVIVFDIETGRVVWQVNNGHEGAVLAVAVSEDLTLVITGSDDKVVRVWDADTGHEVWPSLTGHLGRVTSVAVSRDGRRVVSASFDGEARIWDMKTGEQVGSPLNGYAAPLTSVAVTGDGQRIVTGGKDCTVRVWNAETGQQVGPPLAGHTEWVTCVAVSADGRQVVSGSNDETVRIWEVETGRQVGPPLIGHTTDVKTVAVSVDGKRVVSSGGRTVLVWDAETEQEVGPPRTGHAEGVNSVAVSADLQRVVSGSDDGTVRIWDGETGQQVGRPLIGPKGWVLSVSVSADGRRVVSGSQDGTVHVWDVETGQQVGPPLTLPERSGSVFSVAVSRDGQRVVSGSEDGTVRLWEAETGQQIGPSLTGPRHPVPGVAVSGDGRWVVSWSKSKAYVWDMDTAACIRVIDCKEWRRWDNLRHQHLGQHWNGCSRSGNVNYFRQGRNIVHSAGGSETVVATFEAHVYALAVGKSQIAVAGLMDGTVAIMHIEE